MNQELEQWLDDEFSVSWPNSSRKTNNSGKPDIPNALKLIRLGFKIGGQLSPSVAGYVAHKLWYRPMRKQSSVSERKALESADIKFVCINNHKIATYHWGLTGPIVLLVHGWSGRGTQLGGFTKPLVESGYRVISFDAPAHGQSSGKQTTIYEIADAIIALQSEFGEFDAVLTHSFGGPCTALAMQNGFKTKRLVSISPPATTPGLVDKFSSTTQLPGSVETNLRNRLETRFGKKVWTETSMAHNVKKLSIPGMIIHDLADDYVPWEEGRHVAGEWKNVKFIKTNGLGHRRILRNRRVIESAVNFIKESDEALTN